MLRIFLNDLELGELRRTKGGGAEFTFLPAYLDQIERPVLSQSFIDRLTETFKGSVSRLPTFFRNLLPDPDGRHREHVAQELGLQPHQEFLMLAKLGLDLPGAVRAVPDGDEADLQVDGDASAEPSSHSSIAGMQPKFSAVRDGAALHWLAGGRQSNLIIKPPDPDLPGVPENEYSMMRWAAACGLRVAEVELAPLAKVDPLPDWLRLRKGNALVVKRFDRYGGQRIHIEDMAQAWGHPLCQRE